MELALGEETTYITALNLLLPCCKRTSLTGCFCLRLLWQEDHVTSKPFPHHDAHWKGMAQLSNIWRSQSKALQKVAGRAWEWRLRWMFPNPKYIKIWSDQADPALPNDRFTESVITKDWFDEKATILWGSKVWTICMHLGTLSERPTMLFVVWPWFLHAFPTLYFPIGFC